jgi:hypothetical protein
VPLTFALVAFVALSVLGLLAVPVFAAESVPSIAPYGEVHRFGGLASEAEGVKYEEATTSGLSEAVGPSSEAKFVDPVGMAVDPSDRSAGSDEYAIYVLENTNPQALNALGSVDPAVAGALALEYRIQKLNDVGEVLASVKFTLHSSEAERGLQANAIAVASATQGGRVYVLISDTPEAEPVADRIDVWTTGLKPDEALQVDPATGGGELVGPQTHGTVNVSGIDGVSLAVAGKGAGADVALGGTEYATSSPVIEDIFTEAKGGHQPGELDGAEWHASGTEDSAATAWEQYSESLYSLSANPDGSLNAVLGPTEQYLGRLADEEPNMAWVAPDLAGSPRPILPWADAVEGMRFSEPNVDRAATVGFRSSNTPRHPENYYRSIMETGATEGGGVLGPSVVGLSGGEPDFSNGVYAGVVAHKPSAGNHGAEVESAWRFDFEGKPDIAIRVFDEHEHSLAMIGDVTPGGPCNLEGGPVGGRAEHYEYNEYGSFVAVAAGREDTVFVLVQSHLISTEENGIDPGKPVGGGTGDQVVEFSPGAGQNGKAGTECPQPSFPAPAETFSVTNKLHPEEPLPASGEVTVEKGSELEFNAASANLRGSQPWAYDWSFEPGAPEINNPWFLNSEYEQWDLPLPTQARLFDKTGVFPVTLGVVNDFGTLSATRDVRVAEAKPCVPSFTVEGAVSGQPTKLDASGSVCEGQGDGVKVYTWDFGDHKTQSTPGPSVQHEYEAPGTYTVKLTVTDDLGHPFVVEHQVTISSPPPVEEEKHTVTQIVTTPTTGGGTPLPVTTPAGPSPPPAVKAAVKPLTNAQKLKLALSACRKQSRRKRAGCERAARHRYAQPKDQTGHHKRK